MSSCFQPSTFICLELMKHFSYSLGWKRFQHCNQVSSCFQPANFAQRIRSRYSTRSGGSQPPSWSSAGPTSRPSSESWRRSWTFWSSAMDTFWNGAIASSKQKQNKTKRKTTIKKKRSKDTFEQGCCVLETKTKQKEKIQELEVIHFLE